jgi:hypothetical protein
MFQNNLPYLSPVVATAAFETPVHIRLFGVTLYSIQGDSGGQVSILDSDNIGHCDNKSSYNHVDNSEWLPR